MVKLTEIIEQFPWNPQAPEDWSDKEVYTHTVYPEDSSHIWSVPILSCMQEYAYVGFRIRANIQVFPNSVVLMSGDGKRKPVIYYKEDFQRYGFETVNWTLFRYPLPARLLALDEDEPILEIVFPGDVYGKVEFLAQKFDELEVYNRPLWFCENENTYNGRILTPNGNFYKLDTLTKRKEFPNAVSICSLIS
jgi:hypothetical protein